MIRKILVAVAIVLLGAAAFALGQNSGPVSQASGTVKAPTLSLGSATATRTVTIYTDLDCFKCGRFITQVVPQIRRDYANQVQLHFQLFATTPTAELEAEAAECAADQNFFPDFYDALIAALNQAYWSHGQTVSALSTKMLEQLAGNSNQLINQTQYNRCLETGQFAKAVVELSNRTQNAGFSSGETMVGKQLLQGYQPYGVIKPLIEVQL